MLTKVCHCPGCAQESMTAQQAYTIFTSNSKEMGAHAMYGTYCAKPQRMKGIQISGSHIIPEISVFSNRRQN